MRPKRYLQLTPYYPDGTAGVPESWGEPTDAATVYDALREQIQPEDSIAFKLEAERHDDGSVSWPLHWCSAVFTWEAR